QANRGLTRWRQSPPFLTSGPSAPTSRRAPSSSARAWAAGGTTPSSGRSSMSLSRRRNAPAAPPSTGSPSTARAIPRGRPRAPRGGPAAAFRPLAGGALAGARRLPARLEGRQLPLPPLRPGEHRRARRLAHAAPLAHLVAGAGHRAVSRGAPRAPQLERLHGG